MTDTEPGDANGDGEVTVIDFVNLSRFIAGWDGTSDVDTVALDLDRDRKITSVDITILARHLAGWAGYQTIPFTK